MGVSGGRFLKCRLVQDGRVHCGQCHPYSGGPGLCKEAVARHGGTSLTPSTWEAEAGTSVRSRPAWSTK